jgi:hypothetical protein
LVVNSRLDSEPWADRMARTAVVVDVVGGGRDLAEFEIRVGRRPGTGFGGIFGHDVSVPVPTGGLAVGEGHNTVIGAI